MEMKITLRDHNLAGSNWRAALVPLGCSDLDKDTQPATETGVELHLLFLHTTTTATENFFRKWVTENPNLTSYWNERKAHETGVVPISSGYTLGFWRGREERC